LENNYSYIALIPLLPLAGFLLAGLFGKKYFRRSSGLIATAFLLIATLLSIYAAYYYFFKIGRVDGVYPVVTAFKYTWLRFSENLSIDMGLILDPISVMMMVVITFVSLMVHVFSLWYMKGEERYSTYFSFLGLFTFSMLGLVISTNIFQLYMFWELVGISSYLLIGFYYDRPSAVAAAKKAFIVTRFADLAFLIGILILGFQGETLDFTTLIQRLSDTASPQFIRITGASFFGISLFTWALSLVFIGGAGKSAMLPLHIWLPDAMEGPTPVSALIHAATMVVAGVYLVARLFPLYHINHVSQQLVLYVGTASALFAAVIACTQTDIKRVLAYSTMSQIGFMMMALGVSGYSEYHGLGYAASLFHLFTHAFFKSLLFLAAGVIIHNIHSNEMRDMGSLRRFLPVTHAVFLIACLAISGVPPFAGFFSKEEILLAAYNSNKIVFGIALFTSGLTAFYMFRLYFSIFWNQPMEFHSKHGEMAASIKVPLLLLAMTTVFGGFIPFGHYISADGARLDTHFHLVFSIAPVAFALAGILMATLLYKNKNGRPDRLASAFAGFYQAALKKFYFDELYLFITKKIVFPLVGKPAAWIDRHVIDGLMNGIATATGKTSSLIKGLQSGKVQNYTLYFLAGIVTLSVIFIYLWK